MSTGIASEQAGLRLTPFDPIHAQIVAEWTITPEQLRWLAPSTEPPLTAAKVVAWTKDGGHPFLFMCDGASSPVAYGELNPMRRDVGHMWIGHVVVDPRQRGKGLGQLFVRRLLLEAFRQHAARRISLIVFPENLPAVRCYRRVGFETVGEEHHPFGAGQSVHRMLRLEMRGSP